MLSGLKNLSLMSKIIFLLSLLLLFIWVIPNMVSYYQNMQKYELKAKELKSMAMKSDISGEAKRFNPESFQHDLEEFFSKVDVSSDKENIYQVVIEMDKEKIDFFNDFLETLSLRYLVKVIGSLEFSEKDKNLEVKMMLQPL
jgi:hypothetical protein